MKIQKSIHLLNTQQGSKHSIRPFFIQTMRTLHQARTPQFGDLPAEIKLCIAEHIPPASASYLSLCNRTLEQILGPQSWSSLQHAGYEDRMEFVLTLPRDLPADFSCHGCAR
ncbi:hypothetical protein F5882DRAFT_7016 [Hyaloscypha sp. PMI_1271]|nr:hypothetical protein F5882DRAFT_7016 [Hyaloscypha sp. PMI_1271]